MRTYSIRVNADLVDVLALTSWDWEDLHKVMHNILEWELELAVTGAIPSSVQGRGHPAHIKDCL